MRIRSNTPINQSLKDTSYSMEGTLLKTTDANLTHNGLCISSFELEVGTNAPASFLPVRKTANKFS